jgi:ribosome-binding factor A
VPGVRREKVSELVLGEVARLLQFEVQDSRLGFVTVTGVEMSSDLKHARVFVSLLAEGEARDEALVALRAARGFIRRRLGQTLRLRYTPEIVFILDTSIEYGAKIEKLIERTHQRDPEPDDK